MSYVYLCVQSLISIDVAGCDSHNTTSLNNRIENRQLQASTTGGPDEMNCHNLLFMFPVLFSWSCLLVLFFRCFTSCLCFPAFFLSTLEFHTCVSLSVLALDCSHLCSLALWYKNSPCLPSYLVVIDCLSCVVCFLVSSSRSVSFFFFFSYF